ncbi:hypothetical protein ACTHO5_12700 [Cytobacillus praedii]
MSQNHSINVENVKGNLKDGNVKFVETPAQRISITNKQFDLKEIIHLQQFHLEIFWNYMLKYSKYKKGGDTFAFMAIYGSFSFWIYSYRSYY